MARKSYEMSVRCPECETTNDVLIRHDYGSLVSQTKLMKCRRSKCQHKFHVKIDIGDRDA